MLQYTASPTEGQVLQAIGDVAIDNITFGWSLISKTEAAMKKVLHKNTKPNNLRKKQLNIREGMFSVFPIEEQVCLGNPCIFLLKKGKKNPVSVSIVYLSVS